MGEKVDLDYIKAIKANPKHAKMLDDILAGKRVLTMCVTCGKVFVDMPFNQFEKLYNYNPMDAHKFYCKIMIHFCDHTDHKIVGYSTDNPAFNFSQNLAAQLTLHPISLEVLKNHYQKELKQKENWKL